MCAACLGSALSIRRLKHWHVFIYKSILGLLPSYLHTYICKKNILVAIAFGPTNLSYCLFQWCTELGKKAFQFADPSAWNNLQIRLQLRELVSLDVCKVILNNLET